jgi:hypothetical protein
MMAESVVTMFGSVNDFSAANFDFPGVFLKSLWDAAGDATLFYGTDGDYISSDNTDSTVLNGNISFPTLAISDTTGILIDMYCFVNSPALNFPGYYKIVNVQTNVDITIEPDSLNGQISGITLDENISYSIGGIGNVLDTTVHLQDSLDNISSDCGATDGNAINNLDIYAHAVDALTLTDTININNISGSTTTKVRTISCDSSFIRSDGAVTIDTASAITAILQFFTASTYTQWYGFDLDGGDSATDVIFSADDNSVYHVFENCEIHNATRHNINVRGSVVFTWFFMNCNNHHAGNGITAGSNGINHSSGNRGSFLVEGGSIHDCGGNAWEINNATGILKNTRVYNNLENGMLFGSNTTGRIIVANNTFFSNGNGTGSGIKLSNDTGDNGYIIHNNSFVDNVDYGIEFQHDTPNVCIYLDFNHFDGNGTAATDLTGTIPSQNDISGDPGFVSETPGETGFLRPGESSILNDAGVGGTGDTIGALCAEAGGGAGGGVMPLSGLLG